MNTKRTTSRPRTLRSALAAAAALVLLLGEASLAAEDSLGLGEPVFDLQKPFFHSQTRPGHWLPTITVAGDGAVLVFRDRREEGLIEVHRSEDGGRSWGKPVTVGELVEIEGDTFDDGRYNDWHHGRSILGNVIVDESTGNIMVFTTSMKPAPILYRSKDHGKTWRKENIVIKPDAGGWLSCIMATSEPGITLRYGEKKGRLLMPTRVFVGYLNKGQNRKYYTQHYSNALYSDDHGKTWQPSAPFPETGTGEAGLAELSDGRVYFNSRTHLRPGNRRIAWSDDCGETWKDHHECKFLPDGPPDVYGCKAGLIRLPLDGQDVLVYSSPRDHKGNAREDITVRVSFDGAKTWPLKKLVHEGPGGYTWLAAGRKGTPSEGLIYLLAWENYLARFNLAWISEQGSAGADSGPAMRQTIIEPATPQMPRADTASVAELEDGRLMVVYHKYVPSEHSGHDQGRCHIWSKTSRDGGLTWDSGRMLVDVAPGDMNVQAPALLKLRSGELLLTCLRAHGEGSSSTMCLFRSSDQGRTFVEEPPIWRRSQGQLLQGGASCLLQLKSGRLLLPFHGGTGNQWRQKNSAWCYLSDDQGKTWRRTRDAIELPKRGAMEPSVAQLEDGTLVMSLRTQLGGPYLARSTDEGETWSEPRPSGLEGPESCTCLRRIPGTNDLVLFWNNSKYLAKGHHHYGERTPLTAAVSPDGGKTWRVVGNLGDGPRREYTNLDCTFTSQGKAIVTYLFCEPAWTRDGLSLHATVIDKSWFGAD